MPDAWTSSSGAQKELRVSQLSEEGRELRQESYGVNTAKATDLAFTCAPKTRQLKIELILGQTDTKIAPPASVHILTPSSTFPAISPRDSKLFIKNSRTPVILRAKDISQDAFYKRGEGSKELQWEPKKDAALLIIDELCSGRAFPGESTNFADMVTAETPFQNVQHFPVFRRAEQVATEDLQKFRLLSRVSGKNADILLWNVGISDLQEGVPIERLRTRLLFLAEFARKRQMRPVLMTPPKTVPGVAPQKIYQAALMIKRIGIQENLPVIDAFSRSRLARKDQESDDNGFFSAAKEGEKYLLQTLNRRGRKFYIKLLKEELTGKE